MSKFQLKQLWEDDDGMLQIELFAATPTHSTTQDFYIYPQQLLQFGKDLENYFPKYGKGEVELKYGSELEADRYYSFVHVRFFYLRLGHVGIQVRTNNNQAERERILSEFCIETDLASVNNLGKEIIEWCSDKNDILYFDFART